MSTDVRYEGLEMIPEQVLARAQQAYESDRFAGPDNFDWRNEVRYLLDSGLFTVPQASAITGMSVGHVRRVLAQEEGTVVEGTRSRYGVAGKFNPESLGSMRVLRSQWYSRTPRRSMDPATESQVITLLNEGNGVRVIEHLTTIPSAYIYRARERMKKG